MSINLQETHHMVDDLCYPDAVTMQSTGYVPEETDNNAVVIHSLNHIFVTKLLNEIFNR